MFLEIKGLLNPAEVTRLTEVSRELRFVEGRISNPANLTKNNLQAAHDDPRYVETSQLVMQALLRSREFHDFALPKRIAPPLLCRYEPGMQYGIHADAAYLRGPGGNLRSDVSCTVFVSDPASYEGGELVAHLGTRAVAIKGAAGDAVVYPSTTLHEVRPVQKGTRLVSITFIESLVPEASRRNLLYELGEISALEGLNMRWESRVRLEAVRNNLFRLWSS
jgi:PKHD-type hydroxylase